MSTWRRIEIVLAGLLLLLLALDQALPPPLPADDRGTVVLARDGTPLRTWPSADGVWRQSVTPEQVSPLYLDALLGYEDRWFYWHPGVNPFALGRAGWQWLRHGRVVSGGSTLTMQVARMLDPPAPADRRTLKAKLRQLLRALQLELRLSKREILMLYLDYAPMGGIVEGVEMASRAYLGKSSRDLGVAEAALLAGLPQSPSRLRPDRAPEAARAARDKVLDRMVRLGRWSQAMVDDARIERVAVLPIRAQWLAPLAAERVRQLSRQRGQPRQRVLRTTIDPELQSTVERVLLDRVNGLPPKVSLAALVIDNETLEVLAYAGSADFNDRDRAAHVDMVRGVRSPGSTLKPFLYAMALDEGLVHSESLLVDAPQSFGGYQPGNFQASFSGPVSVSEALQKSLNVPAVDLLDRIGPVRFASQLRSGGIRLRMARGSEPNLSLILGGAGTTLEELVGGYRALARAGLAGRPRLKPEEPRVESRLMSEGAAFIVRDILEGGRGLAWKTGTSFGFRDAWAVGVTGRHTIGVWVGRPDGTPNPGFFGANTAAPLLQDIASALQERSSSTHTPPATVSRSSICWPLGLRKEATPPGQCLSQRTAWLLQGTAPPTLPDRYRTGGLISTCEAGSQQVRWPAALAPWVHEADCSQRSQDSQLRIQGLDAGALLKPVPGHPQVSITVSAAGAASSSDRLYWLLDGVQVRRAMAKEVVNLNLDTAGPHALTLLDEGGRFQRIKFRLAAP